MTSLQTEPNPFALMMEPEAIFAAIATSERLARLKSRICRPLDKIVPVTAGGAACDFDQAIDGADDADEGLASQFAALRD